MKSLKQLIISIAMLLAACMSFSAHAQIPVTDVLMNGQTTMNQIANFAKYVEQISHQVTTIKNQVAQIKSATEGRNIGALLNNDALRQLVPPEMKNAYSDLMSSGVMKNSASAVALLGKIGGSGCALSDSKAQVLCEAKALATPSNLAWLSETVKQTTTRADQIKALIDTINNTPDIKASSDLNARLQGEIAMLNNEAAAAQQGYYMRKEQQDLIQQQRANALPQSSGASFSFR